MREHDLMRLLAGLGGVITLIDTLLGVKADHFDTSKAMVIIVSVVLAAIIILSVAKPGDPIPMNWLLYVGLGIIILIVSSLAGGILVLIAGFIGYTVIN